MTTDLDLRTYRAPTMQEALALVRRELGSNAAVLHTREVRSRGLLGLFPGARQIEVTASVDVVVPSRLPVRAPRTGEERLLPENSGDGYAGAGHARGAALGPQARSAAHAAQPFERQASGAFSPPAIEWAGRDGFRQELKGQLDELHSLVEELCERSRRSTPRDWPDDLFRLYADLIDAEIEEELARELVERVRADASGLPAEMLRARLASLVEEDILPCVPIRITPGATRLVALVGPTGVGKTTTIAKLAANFRLRERRRVGLITVDTYRIAAVEQLRTYADIIDLPMQVVATPREMRHAVRSMAGFDLILLDTAGRSPKDDPKIRELQEFLQEAQADEVHLVLSSVASASALAKTAERFVELGATSLVLTKLDEAHGLGNLLPLLRACKLPLSYLTNGQNVPDDIVEADQRAVARMVAGLAPENEPAATGGFYAET